MKRWALTTLCVLLMMMFPCFAGAEFDAQTAQEWLTQFCAELTSLPQKNDVMATADPARAGEYLLEYDFGTVTATQYPALSAGDILRIELTGNSVKDCRGLRVGQTLEELLSGREIPVSETPLYVLSTQEAGLGLSWAYVGESGIYGVEYITYGGDGLDMKEYTLTYVIKEGAISAIYMQIAESTEAAALEAMRTAEEIAARQMGMVLAKENAQNAFSQEDMTISGKRVIGAPVEELIALIGEPQEIQALPGGGGRMLIYPLCASELMFEEMTGVETLRAFTCAAQEIEGPRGVRVGMTVQEAASLFRCDNDVHSTGGTLYLGGEAQGMAPYAEILPGDAEQYVLHYVCEISAQEVGVLDIGIAEGRVMHFRLSIERTEAAYGG